MQVLWVYSSLGSLSELNHEGTRGASQAYKQALSGALGAGELKLTGHAQSDPQRVCSGLVQ